MSNKTKKKKAPSVKKVSNARKNGKDSLLRRPFLISIGALALAEEQASSLIDSLLDRGEEARKRGQDFMKEREKERENAPEKRKKAKKKSPQKRQKGEDLIARALHLLNIPTLSEVEKLNKKVDALTKKKVA